MTEKFFVCVPKGAKLNFAHTTLFILVQLFLMYVLMVFVHHSQPLPNFSNVSNANFSLDPTKNEINIPTKLERQIDSPPCNLNHSRFAILLTTAVNANAVTKYTHTLSRKIRLAYYHLALSDWLNTTNFTIFVVESSGHTFNISHPRFYQYSLILPPKSCVTSSQAEATSILNATNSHILDCYDFIIKITGKYFVPNLATHLSKVPGDTDVILQSIRGNSELFGFKRKLANELLSPLLAGKKLFEERIKEIRLSGKFKLHKLQRIWLRRPVQRDSGDWLQFLK